MSKVFKRTGGAHPRRSMFNLSYEKKFTCDMGELIPVMCDEVVPGDFFKIGNQAVIRFQPLVAPILHEINMYVHYFFVPYRILWDEFETYITGGIDGDDATLLPTWNPTNPTNVGELWDYLGFPLVEPAAFIRPCDFPRRAYNRIYNEYYRDENLQTEVAETNELILNRNWEKDYFTSALLWQQRGTAPALPVTITGTSAAIWDSGDFYLNSTSAGEQALNVEGGTTPLIAFYSENANSVANAHLSLNHNTVDLSTATATTFDVSDLRLAFQIQKWMERNARAGVRYTEFLKAHFGISPRDDRLQRPEYIGGSKSPIIISEVLQTSSTDGTSPQGNLAGHGIGISDAYCGKFHVNEYGLIMGIMSVMPKPAYSQGINRQWIKSNRYSWYFPEFANLSEQPVYQGELLIDGTANDVATFGYQGMYDEMRVKQNLICSGMRSTFDYWHLAREFNPASPPALNSAFITCIPDKRIFASQDEDGLIISFANIIKAFRPLPIMAEPGLIDHN